MTSLGVLPAAAHERDVWAPAAPAAAPAHAWDEEIVPALRKRLEAESAKLGRRISRIDAVGPDAWAPLGADALAARAARSAHRGDAEPAAGGTAPRSVTGPWQPQPQPQHAGVEAESQEAKRERARQRARSLARERGSAGSLRGAKEDPRRRAPAEAPPPLPGMGDAEPSSSAGRTRVAALQAAEPSPRMRTLSTPMRPPAVVRRPSVGTAAAGAATRTKPHQAHAERSPSPPDTRIQAPVQRPRRTSSARANGQDGTAKPNGMASHASSRSMASAGPPATPPPAVRPYEPPATLPNMRSRRDSTPSDAMLSDFGPLGGVPSPARQRGATLGGAPGTPQRESASNSAPASPWDEVLPPAIARRVAQERLIAEGAGADGLIDTWDTRGMPLSKSQMALRDSRDREEQAARLQAINAQAEAEAKLLDEQQALEAQQQHLLPAPHLSSDKRSSDATPASVRRSGRQDASSSSQPFTNLDTARYPPHAPADARPQQPQPADDGAGCCKCSVM